MTIELPISININKDALTRSVCNGYKAKLKIRRQCKHCNLPNEGRYCHKCTRVAEQIMMDKDKIFAIMKENNDETN